MCMKTLTGSWAAAKILCWHILWARHKVQHGSRLSGRACQVIGSQSVKQRLSTHETPERCFAFTQTGRITMKISDKPHHLEKFLAITAKQERLEFPSGICQLQLDTVQPPTAVIACRSFGANGMGQAAGA